MKAFKAEREAEREGLKIWKKNQSNHWKEWFSLEYLRKSLIQKDVELEGLPDDYGASWCIWAECWLLFIQTSALIVASFP